MSIPPTVEDWQCVNPERKGEKVDAMNMIGAGFKFCSQYPGIFQNILFIDTSPKYLGPYIFFGGGVLGGCLILD